MNTTPRTPPRFVPTLTEVVQPPMEIPVLVLADAVEPAPEPVAAGISQRDGLVVLGGYVMVVLTIVYFAGLALLAYSAGQSFSLFG